jgi:ribulose-5-phosphate 4-epimerase/fuculose-1-phosphate aldolase
MQQPQTLRELCGQAVRCACISSQPKQVSSRHYRRNNAMHLSPIVASASPQIIGDLVTANKILFRQKIVDAYGHISVRHDKDAEKYLMSRLCAPGLVTLDQIDAYDLDSNPLGDHGKPYNERYIHGEIYKARPDVQSIIHCHTPHLIPFGVTKTPLRPLYQMSSFLGSDIPVFEIREAAGMTDLLVRNPALGAALAAKLSSRSLVLMRGHGATIVAGSIRAAVYRSIYAAENAWLQMEAMKLGEVNYLTTEEMALGTPINDGSTDRPWAIWCDDVDHSHFGQGHDLG